MKIYNLMSAPKLNHYQSFKGEDRGYINIPLSWDDAEEDIYLKSINNNTNKSLTNDTFFSNSSSNPKSESKAKNYIKGAVITGTGLSVLPDAIDKVGNAIQGTVDNIENSVSNSTEKLSQSIARLKELKHNAIDAWKKGQDSIINKDDTTNNSIDNTDSLENLNKDNFSTQHIQENFQLENPTKNEAEYEPSNILEEPENDLDDTL